MFILSRVKYRRRRTRKNRMRVQSKSRGEHEEENAKQEVRMPGRRTKRQGGWERHLIPRMTLLGWGRCARPGRAGIRQAEAGDGEANMKQIR